MAKKNRKWKENTVATETEDKSEGVKGQPSKGSAAAGLEKIKEVIDLLKTNSAASIGGSMLSEAVILLEQGYDILGGNNEELNKPGV